MYNFYIIACMASMFNSWLPLPDISGDCFSISELEGHFIFRLVEHGMTVRGDAADIFQIVFFDEPTHRLSSEVSIVDMQLNELFAGQRRCLSQLFGPFRRIRYRFSDYQPVGPCVIGWRTSEVRAAQIDAVERRSGHQTDHPVRQDRRFVVRSFQWSAGRGHVWQSAGNKRQSIVPT